MHNDGTMSGSNEIFDNVSADRLRDVSIDVLDDGVLDGSEVSRFEGLLDGFKDDSLHGLDVGM